MTMDEIIERAGGVTKLAAIVARHHSTVLGWKRVPAQHVRPIARALSVPVEAILDPETPAPPGHDQAGHMEHAA